ncbi:MAG: SulP family inorganic anion transporter [Gammaproteobacteria bacterium]
MPMAALIPNWMRDYSRAQFPGDLAAGVTVAMLLIPQSMAYALIAGLPPVMGLYAAVIPLVVYALLGSSPVLSVGPVAIDSLLVAGALAAAGLTGIAAPQAAAALAVLTGALLLVMRAARCDALANFMSQPVIAGFGAAAAVLIGASQLASLLGLHATADATLVESLRALWRALPQANPTAAMVGGTALALLFLARGVVTPRLRRAGASRAVTDLIAAGATGAVVVLGVVAVRLGGLDRLHGVEVIGPIPRVPPAPQLPAPDSNVWRTLLPHAALIAVVCFLESIAIAQTLASRRRRKIDAGRELVALGSANIAAALAGGYNVSGGVSRSMINFSSGANTPLASIVAAFAVAAGALLLAPALEHLPKAVLAALVLAAVAKIADADALRRIWRYDRLDALPALATFAAALGHGVQSGILAGVAVSLGLHLWRTSRPHIAIVGRVGESEHFRNVARHAVRTCDHVLAVRIDESLYFANAHALEALVLQRVSAQPALRHVVLVAAAINHIDASALETLAMLRDRLRASRVTLHLAEVKGPVMDRLARTDFVEALAPGQVFLSTHQAMRALECC